MAEAFLIRRQYKEAGELYQAAVDMAPKEIGSHQSTWRQAARLLAKLGSTGEERALVERAFRHLQ